MYGLMIGITGITNLILVIFQLLSGLHIVKVNINLHKKAGMALCFSALLHIVFISLAH
jgi:hypothetical protein